MNDLEADGRLSPVRLAGFVSDAFGWRVQGAPAPVEDSVLNRNYRVETGHDPWFVRVHKQKRTVERLLAEHRAIAHAALNGIAVAAPLVWPDGRTFAECDGRLVAVFPWVEGRTAVRGSLTVPEAATLGDIQGRVQVAFADYRDPALTPGSETVWDTAASIAALTRVDDVIRYYPAPGAERVEAQRLLRLQLAVLESDVPRPHTDFAQLPRQVDHGDLHERNVVLNADGGVAAVVDWERVGVFPRVYELLRGLDFSGAIVEPSLAEAWVGGFARHVRLARDEIVTGMEMARHEFLHNTWVFTDVFIRGNEAVARFLPETEPRLRWWEDAALRGWLVGVLRRAMDV